MEPSESQIEQLQLCVERNNWPGFNNTIGCMTVRGAHFAMARLTFDALKKLNVPQTVVVNE